MSMEITNNYSNYAANYADTVKKSDSKAAAEVKTNTSTNSKDKVQAYYEQLCKKFPQINFNTSGGVLPSNSNRVTVNLSYDCLKKMQKKSNGICREKLLQTQWFMGGRREMVSYLAEGLLHMMPMATGSHPVAA